MFASARAYGERFTERKVRTLFVDGHGLENKPWIKLAASDKESLAILIKLLGQSKTGKFLLNLARQQAGKQMKNLSEVIKAGNNSITDTTLIRKFSASDPNEIKYEGRATVYLDRGLTVMDGLLDLAHELTHFVMRKAFNPYVKNFSFKEFLISTVEGKGGEVDAYLVECQVYKELYPGKFYKNSNCLKVYDQKSGKFSKSKGIKSFYQIGKFLHEFKKTVNIMQLQETDFPHISGGEPLFISSAYGLPYPVAAMEEYRSILGKVCRNDYRRLGYLKKQQLRFPASVSADGSHWQDLNSKLVRKCRGIANTQI